MPRSLNPRAARRPSPGHLAVPVVVAALAAGCLDPVVGGSCAQGFVMEDGTCVPETAAPRADAAVQVDTGTDDTGALPDGGPLTLVDVADPTDGGARVDAPWTLDGPITVNPSDGALADGATADWDGGPPATDGAVAVTDGGVPAADGSGSAVDGNVPADVTDTDGAVDPGTDASGSTDGTVATDAAATDAPGPDGGAGVGADGGAGTADDTITGGAADGAGAGEDVGGALDAGVTGGGGALDAGVTGGGGALDAGVTGGGGGGSGGGGGDDGGVAGGMTADASPADGSAPDDAASDATDCGGRTLCGSTCVDLNHDPANCGACGNACMDGAACSDGTCVTVCPPPTVNCGGTCVDLSSDPDSCGSCFAYCPTGICNGGVCRAGRVGHLAVIGHDYTVGRVDQNRLVGNAAFLSSHVPLRVLSLSTYSDPTARGNVDSAIRQVAGTRAWGRWEVVDPALLGAELTVDRYDVFLVFAQTAATDDQISALAHTISGPLVGFASAGGVVIVLDGMGTNRGTFPIVNQTGLVSVDALTNVTGQSLDVTGPVDALAVGLPAGYRAERTSVAFHLPAAPSGVGLTTASTAETSSVVTTTDGPVVLHSVVLPPRH